MGQTTGTTPTVGAMEAANAEEHHNHEALPCPNSIPPQMHNCKPSHAIAADVILPCCGAGAARPVSGANSWPSPACGIAPSGTAWRPCDGAGSWCAAMNTGITFPPRWVLDFIAQEERRARSTFRTLQPARRLAAQMQAEVQGEQLKAEGV